MEQLARRLSAQAAQATRRVRLAEHPEQEAFRWASVLGRMALALGALASEPESCRWVSPEGILRAPGALVLAWLVSLEPLESSESCAWVMESNRLAKEVQEPLVKETTFPLAWDSCPGRLGCPARLVRSAPSVERLV